MSSIQNLFYGVQSVTSYGGATVAETYSDNWGAVTFGSYIIGSRGIQANPTNSLFQHEYGHYLQSQATGPFYLQRYGIPSAFSKGDHDLHPVEQDANARALKYFNKHVDGFESFDEEGLYTGGWVRRQNPIIGYDWNQPFNNETNQTAIKNAQLGLTWYDWVFGPNYIINSWIHVLKLNKNQ
jgi:hypothetical protein